MGYIPPDAKWYLADMVEEFTVEGEPDNLVHTNMILIRADSPEEAFQRAEALGQEYNMTYTNPYGKLVTVVYRGLRDLNVIHGELEHGTELIYDKKVGLSAQELAAWVTPKAELGVFKPMEPYGRELPQYLEDIEFLDHITQEFLDDLLLDTLDDWAVAAKYGEFLVALCPTLLIGHLVLCRAHRHAGDVLRAIEQLRICGTIVTSPGFHEQAFLP